MGIKDFLLKQALKHKMKNAPEKERERLLAIMEKNPDFFNKIGEEIQRRVKSGQGELSATMAVMRENQAKLQKIMLEQ